MCAQCQAVEIWIDRIFFVLRAGMQAEC
jgi:hypothetical protein